MSFKADFPFEKRLEVAQKIRSKYPDRIPVIVERAPNDTAVPLCEKKKFLVPCAITVGEFMHEIRRHMPHLASSQAIFLFVCGEGGKPRLPAHSSLMSEIYEAHADSDQFVYILYSGENSFGSL